MWSQIKLPPSICSNLSSYQIKWAESVFLPEPSPPISSFSVPSSPPAPCLVFCQCKATSPPQTCMPQSPFFICDADSDPSFGLLIPLFPVCALTPSLLCCLFLGLGFEHWQGRNSFAIQCPGVWLGVTFTSSSTDACTHSHIHKHTCNFKTKNLNKQTNKRTRQQQQSPLSQIKLKWNKI